MEYRWIEGIGEFNDISSEWDKALMDSADHNPFLLSDFIITWWKHFGAGRVLKIFMVYDDGKIVGGVPLYLERRGVVPIRTGILYYIGNSAANYTEPYYAGPGSKVLPLLKKAILEDRDIDAISLANVRAENPIISEYAKGANDGNYLSYMLQDHFNMTIDLSGGTENYFSSLTGKLKKDLRQKRKHAVKDYGKIELRKVSGREEIKKYYDLYVGFTTDAFRKRGRRNTFEDVRYRAFFEDLLMVMEEKGRSDAFALFAGNNVIAIVFGYRFGNGFNWALTSFNYDFKYIRPGYLLVEELVKEIVGRGESSCNCYGHESFYKSQWCNNKTPMYRIHIAKRTPKGALYMLLQHVLGYMRAKKSIVSAVRKLKKA